MAAARRLRTYLTPDEVARLLRAAKKSRHGARNHAMILLAYRHGLRASEVSAIGILEPLDDRHIRASA
jgi:integrase